MSDERVRAVARALAAVVAEQNNAPCDVSDAMPMAQRFVAVYDALRDFDEHEARGIAHEGKVT